MSAEWACPCRGPCPHCGFVADAEDREHPEDGLAYCLRCPQWASEWWASCGPYMSGRCPADAAELTEWEAHDSAVMRGDHNGRVVLDPKRLP